MSKAELVVSIQKALGKETSIAQAERVLSAVIENIKSGVKKTKSVQRSGLPPSKWLPARLAPE
jgi:nucleoid DNA-binding protein